MPSSSDAINDPARLEALRAADLLDTPEEEGFDSLACMAARLLAAPTALVSLVDVHRQFLKSCIGEYPEPFRSMREAPLSYSFCRHVVITQEPLLIEDATESPLVRDNPAVIEYGVRAYAGFPLLASDGQVIGTLCVVDTRSRKWDPGQVETLRSLAAAATTLVKYRSPARARTASPEDPGVAVTTPRSVLSTKDALGGRSPNISQF